MSAIERDLAELLMDLRARARRVRGPEPERAKLGLLEFRYRAHGADEQLIIEWPPGSRPEGALLQQVWEVLPPALYPSKRMDGRSWVLYEMSEVRPHSKPGIVANLRRGGYDTGHCTRCGFDNLSASAKAEGVRLCVVCVGGKETRCRDCGLTINDDPAYNPMRCTRCAFAYGQEYAAELQAKRAAATANEGEGDG